jgi:flagellar biosynthesis protein FlhF
MELKRILARDSRSAHEQALARFGPEALVISASQIDGQTELIVAVDLDASDPYALLPGSTSTPTDTPDEPEFQPFKAAMEVVLRHQAVMERQAARQDLHEPPTRPEPVRAESVRADAVRAESVRAEPLRTEPAQPRLIPPRGVHAPPESTVAMTSPTRPVPTPDQASAVPDAEALRSREIVDLIRAEIADLRQEIQSVKSPALVPSRRRFSRAVQPIANAVRRSCGDSILSAALLNALTQAEDVHEADAALRAGLAERLPGAAACPESGIHALLGSSGSGKTLLSAKLLARAARSTPTEHLAWVTYGEARPGAWGQAQMLASLVGVELFRARDQSTLGLVLDELSDRVLIVIDTPGHELAQHAQALAAVSPSIQRHLVIPAELSAASARRLCALGATPWQGVFLSKVDEIEHPWPLVDLLGSLQGMNIGAVNACHRLSDPLQPYLPDKLLESALAYLSESLEAAAQPAAAAPFESPGSYSSHVHG